MNSVKTSYNTIIRFLIIYKTVFLPTASSQTSKLQVKLYFTEIFYVNHVRPSEGTTRKNKAKTKEFFIV